MSAGLALFDYDSDGDVDIYFLNGAPLSGARMAPPPRNALYRNDGGWKFTDVTEAAGVGEALSARRGRGRRDGRDPRPGGVAGSAS